MVFELQRFGAVVPGFHVVNKGSHPAYESCNMCLMYDSADSAFNENMLHAIGVGEQIESAINITMIIHESQKLKRVFLLLFLRHVNSLLTTLHPPHSHDTHTHALTRTASAAPIPPRLTRQPPNSFNNTFFPYTVLGPVPPPVHQPGSVLDTCFTENTYAISFDDGPGQLTDELLDFLDEQNLKVTFFVNGDNWSCVYSKFFTTCLLFFACLVDLLQNDQVFTLGLFFSFLSFFFFFPSPPGTESQRLLKRAYAAQHQIAAHPWSHQDLESLSDDAIRQEMFKMEQAFRQILGVVPRYMRPPFGEHSPRVRGVLQQLGYVLVLWDVDQHPAKAKGIESSDNSPSVQKPMGGHAHHHSSSSEQSFASNRAEAVRGVPPAVPLDRDAMSLSGIFQEATSIWALEYVESVGYAIQPVGTCLGEVDPRLWYKEIGPAAPEGSIPTTCS